MHSSDHPPASEHKIEVEIADAWLKVSMAKYLQLIAAAERLGKSLIELQHDELLNMVQQMEKEHPVKP